MDKSKLEEQKNKILESIYDYSNIHGIDVKADIVKGLDNSFIINISHGHKEIKKEISSIELSNLDSLGIEQMVEQLLRNFYEPRPPRATP